MEESRSDAEERLRSQVVANSTLKATNTKLTSHIHALNSDITELQAVSHELVIVTHNIIYIFFAYLAFAWKGMLMSMLPIISFP